MYKFLLQLFLTCVVLVSGDRDDWPCYSNWNNGWYCPSLTSPEDICSVSKSDNNYNRRLLGYQKKKAVDPVCVEITDYNDGSWPEDAMPYSEIFPCLYEIDFTVVDCFSPCDNRMKGPGDLFGIWVEVSNKDELNANLDDRLKLVIYGDDLTGLCCYADVGPGGDDYSAIVANGLFDCFNVNSHSETKYECGRENSLDGCDWSPKDFVLKVGHYENDHVYQTRIRIHSNSCNLLDNFKFGWVLQQTGKNKRFITKITQTQQCPIPTGSRASDNSPFP